MNLSDYINLTITEIADGAKKADATLKEIGNGCVLTHGTTLDLNEVPHISTKYMGKTYNRPIINIAFRVNLELQETEESNGEIKGSLKVISGNIGTGSSERTTTSAEVSFCVPVLLPYEQQQTGTTLSSYQD